MRYGAIQAIIIAVAACFTLNGAEPRGEWQAVHLDSRHIALTGMYDGFLRDEFVHPTQTISEEEFAKLPEWAKEMRFSNAATELIARHRPALVAQLRDFSRLEVLSEAGERLAITDAGYWLNPIGQARFTDIDANERLTHNADVAHFIFISLAQEMSDGATYSILLPTGEQLNFSYTPASTPSPMFKLNQLGYMPQAGEKYAYLGAWLGTAGALPMAEHYGKSFELVRADSGEVVLNGQVTPRMEDPTTANGAPFTGEEVAELDISGVTTPGVYFLRIANVGRSSEFRIGKETMAEAFYLHARGLYHKRCGIAKEEPYTHWLCPSCHHEVVRGSFPPDQRHYTASANDSRDFGFFDGKGKSISVNHFRLIRANSPIPREILQLPGGWHDAADFDRRPFHLAIVGDLAAVYLLKPENFSDGQLNIPESGNLIPDILDEARWGLEHLRRAQQPDGGVGTWIEAGRHPLPSEYLPSNDLQEYQLALATRAGSLEYAAYAATLALALRRAGDEAGSQLYAESAQRAWDYAMNSENRAIRFYNYSLDGKDQTIIYREPAELPAEFLLKAGFDLYLLFDDPLFLEPLRESTEAILAAHGRNSWRWSPLMWMELEIFADKAEPIMPIRLAWRSGILRNANTLLRQQNNNYPYRIAWFGARESWVHSMSWGTYHPLRRALVWVAAHACTNERKFIDAALLANDFHNGANPSGMTMTGGLGRVYPVRFLDLTSYADGIAEFVPGITPYRNTYGIARDAVKTAYGLFYQPRRDQGFEGLALSIFPQVGLTEQECAVALDRLWPIWRRWANVEAYSVAASEYTVWETISPAAVVTGYLLNGATPPTAEQRDRRPVENIRKLPGYAPLP